MKKIITHLVAAYVGAGLFGGLVMQAAVPPMNNFGVAFYGFTWPAFLVCARTEADFQYSFQFDDGYRSIDAATPEEWNKAANFANKPN